MKNIYLKDENSNRIEFQYEQLSDIKTELEKRYIVIGNGCKLGNGCELGNGCKLGDGCELGYRCELGDGCKLGYRCELGDIIIPNGYKYIARGYLNTSNGLNYVQLGCYLRTIQEWDADFWNNPDEFTEGTDQGNVRWNVFNQIKTFLTNTTK